MISGMLGKNQSDHQKQRARYTMLGNTHGCGKRSLDACKNISQGRIGNKAVVGLVWINFDTVEKRIKVDAFQSYFDDGWYLGRSYECNKNNSDTNKVRVRKKGYFIVPRENRTCACGCGETFVCKVRDPKRFKNRKHIIKTEEHLRNILKQVCSRPNTNEVRGMAYLEKLYPGRFSYTGDGTCIIAGRSADAVDLKTRTVALFHGTYFHCKPTLYDYSFYNKTRQMTAQEIWEYDKETERRFIQAGYKVIVLWEDEI